MIFFDLRKPRFFVLIAAIITVTTLAIYSSSIKSTDSVTHVKPTFEQTLAIIKPDIPITIKTKDLTIATKQPLHNVQVEKYKDPVLLNGASSIAKVFKIHPENNHNLDAEITFTYEESELNGLVENKLILYSSEDEGLTWSPHFNTQRDLANNTLYLPELSHFSLWTAGETTLEEENILSAMMTSGFPGGVDTDIVLWLKGDAGITEEDGKVSGWDDRSGSASHAFQTDQVKQPSYTAASPFFNDNPSVDFPQTSGIGMHTSAGLSNHLYSCFVVYNSTTNSTAARRGVQSSVNWLIGPYANNTGFHSGPWVHYGAPNPTLVPAINTATSDGTNANNAFFHLNGKLMSPAAGVTSTTAPQTLSLGAVGAYNQPMGGSIAEVIAFSRYVDATERNQIESYLAMKYGITLDQAIASNYYNSAGSIVWDASANGVYNKNIFGLAHDFDSELLIEQSRSATSNLIQLSNPATLLDGDFLFLSDNGLSGTPTPQSGLPGGATHATNLSWNVSKIGTVGTVD